MIGSAERSRAAAARGYRLCYYIQGPRHYNGSRNTASIFVAFKIFHSAMWCGCDTGRRISYIRGGVAVTAWLSVDQKQNAGIRSNILTHHARPTIESVDM